MRHISILFSAFLILMIAAGCWHPGFLRKTEESAWYRMRLLDAQQYNSKFAHLENHDRKEIWAVEIGSVENLQIWASSQKCLYAHSGSLTGYCSGGDRRFLLKTYFLKPPLKKGDVIIFSVFHRTVHSVLDGDATLHLIEGTSMAKVDPETGEPTPLEYDRAAFLAEAEAEKTFRRLCIAKAKGLQPLEQTLKDGADPNVLEGRGGRSFFIYCLERDTTSPEELKLLLRYGAQPMFAAQDRLTPLSVAAAREKDPLTFCRILLEAGADPNQNPGYKNALSRVAVPPLFIAVRRNHLKLAELLLEHGADPLFNLPPPFFSMPQPRKQQPLGWRPIDEVRDYRMAELLMKFGAKTFKSPSMGKVIYERITAPVPEE